MMLSLDTAYRSFGGEVEASSTPTICRLSDSRRHQLSAIAQAQMSAMEDSLPKSKYFEKGVKVSSHSTDVESAMLGAQIISALERAGMKPFDRRMTYTTVG